MGTRGTYGFHVDGQDKLSYNHFDSYPTGLGNDVLKALKAWLDRPDFAEKARSIKLIDQDTTPTAADIEACKPYTNLGVSRQSTQDWYCLLREAQGDLDAALKTGILLERNDFIKDSLFCEWGYIVNLDDQTLEIYRGFQGEPHQAGRYANGEADRGYYPCALIKAIPFADLPDDLEPIETEIYGEDE